MLLNVTKVNQQIRKSHQLFWGRKDGQDIVCNGYWLIKANLSKTEYRKILGLLVEKLGIMPKEQELLAYRRNYKTKEFETTVDPKGDRFDLFLDIPKTKVEDTELIEKTETGQIIDARIFKGNEYIYINRNYMDMISRNGLLEYFSKGYLNPIYAVDMLTNEFLMVLPIRMPECNKHLKEIEPITAK